MEDSQTDLENFFVDRGLVSREQLQSLLEEQRQSGIFLGTLLTQKGFLSEQQLVPALAEYLDLPFVNLDEITVDPDALSRVPAKLATTYNLFPVSYRDNQLQVAIADPFDVRTLDELTLLVDCKIKPVMAGSAGIRKAIQTHYGVGASTVKQLVDSSAGEGRENRKPLAEDISSLADATSIVSFVNELLMQAVKARATDLHLEPYEENMRVRQRIDGILYEIPVPKDVKTLHQAVVSRIKVMAALDIAERRLPQDGRIKIRIVGEELDLRVSILPTAYGEAVDIRILSAQGLLSLEQLGLAEDHRDTFEKLIANPHGIIFVTGPTGSGKSTTVYACLSKLNQPGRMILTIEDPIEYHIPGMVQMQVHPKIGLSFAQGLRSMLRHDPDVMMVGEVRDVETAEITIRSSLTGHLVFSTLHTNDAAGGVARLIDMGTEPYLVSSSVLAFLAQRLVRMICQDCRKPHDPDPSLMRDFEIQQLPAHIMRGEGCASCMHTGYRGRTAIHELLLMSDSIQSLILQRASAQEIAAEARRQGMRTLRQDGWQRVLRGITTPEEVLRVA